MARRRSVGQVWSWRRLICAMLLGFLVSTATAWITLLPKSAKDKLGIPRKHVRFGTVAVVDDDYVTNQTYSSGRQVWMGGYSESQAEFDEWYSESLTLGCVPGPKPSWVRVPPRAEEPEDQLKIASIGYGWPVATMRSYRSVRHIEGEVQLTRIGEVGVPWTTMYLPMYPAPVGFIAVTATTGLLAYSVRTVWVCAPTWRRLRHGRCPQCNYDLAGDLTPGCPECGWNREPATG